MSSSRTDRRRLLTVAGIAGATGAWRTGPIVGVSGKCADVNGTSSADGTQLIIWTCRGGTNQEWTLP